jgi:predicted glycoside hydrolase/deacetylase ChbG (UPF0249 family)
MESNPVLKRLGLGDSDRAVIIHADDVGMCQASLAAYADLVDFGLVSAASVMVPCAWFPATAAFCRDNAGRVDMGVHTTLTSEWEGYRWGPISTRDPGSGLVDSEGYFYHSTEEAQARGRPEAVGREIEAQVERALAEGIDLTHVDTHMGTVFHPQFLGAYVGTALQHGLPPFLLRKDREELEEMGVETEVAAMFVEQLKMFEAQGIPLLDEIQMMPLDQPEDRAGQVKEVLAGLPAGITYLIIHPAQDSPELRAITPDWPSRVADYQAFSSEAVRELFQASGITVLGWRVLRDLMREGQVRA